MVEGQFKEGLFGETSRLGIPGQEDNVIAVLVGDPKYAVLIQQSEVPGGFSMGRELLRCCEDIRGDGKLRDLPGVEEI